MLEKQKNGSSRLHSPARSSLLKSGASWYVDGLTGEGEEIEVLPGSG